MAIEDRRHGAQALNNKLQNLVDFQQLNAGRFPEWYGRMISALLLATDGAEPKYVTGTYKETDDVESFASEVAVFTDTLLVRTTVTGKPTPGTSGPIFVTVTPRSALVKFAVAAQQGVFLDDSFDTWPGQIQLKVTYPEFELTLPLGPSRTSAHEVESVELLDGLRKDVLGAQ